jgi:hypothetical protein
MNKTVKEHLLTFVKWFLLSLLTVSGLANLGFWFYIGEAFWFHKNHYLWIALWWLIATVPNSVFKVYLSRQNKNKNKVVQ